ncbi:MAG: hypothetical protein COZ18_01275 [Flexibacter sp. CG_4_10_14_3_um_filter_32_15]|nr:MAG: hypothetical protein COZ18_01275 [Flexibacter sp. CG_4_10_14_3_um_filter_32_15]
MKKYLLMFLYLNLSSSVFGQTDTIFQKRDIIQRVNSNFGRIDTTYKLLDSTQTIISKKDTSKLQVRRFYSNDVLRSEVDFYGDSLHGNNLYYHDNGKLAIKKRYLNDKLVGEVKKYDSLGNQILPAFIPQKRVYNVWNQTELKVYL